MRARKDTFLECLGFIAERGASIDKLAPAGGCDPPPRVEGEWPYSPPGRRSSVAAGG